MDVKILQLIEGAKRAEGLTVIIDVFRAVTVEAILIANGVKRIIPVAFKELAYQLKEENPDYLLIGERHGVMLPGFDYGNSPSQIKHVDFSGKTVVHTTSSGTQGFHHAVRATEILPGAFVNARAIAHYIASKQPEVVSLVAMGWEGVSSTDEDVLCAMYIKAILEDREQDIDLAAETDRIRYGSGAHFFDPDQPAFPEADFALCMAADRYDFVLKVEQDRKTGLPIILAED